MLRSGKSILYPIIINTSNFKCPSFYYYRFHWEPKVFTLLQFIPLSQNFNVNTGNGNCPHWHNNRICYYLWFNIKYYFFTRIYINVISENIARGYIISIRSNLFLKSVWYWHRPNNNKLSAYGYFSEIAEYQST